MRSVFGFLRRRATWASGATLLSASAISILLSAQSASLMLVSTEWPPFTSSPGRPRFALDLVEAALRRSGVTAKTTIVGAAQFTPALLQEKFDGSGAAWKDAERERVMLFSQPYLENRLVLVGRSGADVTAKTLADLKGKRIAIVDGYSYGDIASAGPVWVRASSEEDSVSRLVKRTVDFTLMDELVVQYLVDNYPQESSTKLQIGSTPLLIRTLHLIVRRSRPDAEGIISRFNAQIRSMIVDRTYHQLLHVDWIEADVNGDGVPEYVPRTDRTGPSEPVRIYNLFSTPPPPVGTPVPNKPGFYVGGNIYADWASVPENYKLSNSDKPDPSRSTASIFKFAW